MNLQELIQRHSRNFLHAELTGRFMGLSSAEQAELLAVDLTEIDSVLTQTANTPERILSPEEIEQFSLYIKNISGPLQQWIICFLFSTFFDKYFNDTIESRLQDLSEQIAAAVRNKLPVPQHPSDALLFNPVWNYIQLIRVFGRQYAIGNNPPDINPFHVRAFNWELPMMCNAMRLTGIVPEGHPFSGDQFFYFPEYKSRQAVLSPGPGIQASAPLIPFKAVKKIYAGDTGHNTVLATDGRKLCFMLRSNHNEQASDAVFASKIARLVSSKHFSSERLLDNKMIASREHPAYVKSIADVWEKVVAMQQAGHVFEGSATIDEVTNFLRELDKNVENYGISANELSDPHAIWLSKIDFDGCVFFLPVNEYNYEQNIILSSEAYDAYRAQIIQRPAWYHEQLATRLKLILIPELLFKALANKAYIDQDEKAQEAINACLARQAVAMQLFLEHPKSADFLRDNPGIVDTCVEGIKAYIDGHKRFHVPHADILAAIDARAAEISRDIVADECMACGSCSLG